MIIRRLNSTDVDAYRMLRFRALQEDPTSFAVSYEEMLAESKEVSKEKLESAEGDNFVIGAFDADLCGIVGFTREKYASRRHKGFIWGMYVPAEHRGKGIGHTLLQHLVLEARKQEGLEQLFLIVGAHNDAAQRLYRRCGFEIYAKEPQGLKINNQYYDDIFMLRSIDEQTPNS